MLNPHGQEILYTEHRVAALVLMTAIIVHFYIGMAANLGTLGALLLGQESSMMKKSTIVIGLVFAFGFAGAFAAPSAIAGDGLVEMKIELPNAMFRGTPKEVKSTKLDPSTGKKRKPFMAPEDVMIVSTGKCVTASDDDPVIGELEMITDADKEGAEGSFVEFGQDVQWVQIDLGEQCEIHAILVWHYHSMARIYKDVVAKVADDADFVENVQTVYNNDYDNSAGLGVGKDWEYIETNEGRLIDAKGVKARYVRLYSNGNSSNDMNHVTEVEVWGRPVK